MSRRDPFADLDAKLRHILVRLATSSRGAHDIHYVLDTQTDPSEAISDILYDQRKGLRGL